MLKSNQLKPQAVTPGISQEVECVASDSTQEIVPQMTKSHKGSQVEGDQRVKCEVIRHIMDHQGVTE